MGRSAQIPPLSMPLTDTVIRQAKPSEKPRKLADGGGLYLLVNQTGKYWRWKYRFRGKEKLMALGVYPRVSLAKARQLHQDARSILDAGQDPMSKRQETGPAELTFEQAARQWWTHWSPGRSERHAGYVLTRMEADAFPKLGALPVASVPASAFRDMAKAVEERGALDIARRLLQTCGQVMRYAVAHDLAERNPVADVRPADILKARKKRNYARVTDKELPDLLRAIDTYTGSEYTTLALQLMAYTFVRTSELIGARFDEFDLTAKRWNIPAERMKMDTPHIVPLSDQVVAIVERTKELAFGADLLFPGERDRRKPISNNTILYALYRLGYRSRMTGHGFRGVASTILHEHGWPHDHIELQLAHQERNEVSAAYNHALYLAPRAKMMQWWADHLDKMKRAGHD